MSLMPIIIIYPTFAVHSKADWVTYGHFEEDGPHSAPAILSSVDDDHEPGLRLVQPETVTLGGLPCHLCTLGGLPC